MKDTCKKDNWPRCFAYLRQPAERSQPPCVFATTRDFKQACERITACELLHPTEVRRLSRVYQRELEGRLSYPNAIAIVQSLWPHDSSAIQQGPVGRSQVLEPVVVPVRAHPDVTAGAPPISELQAIGLTANHDGILDEHMGADVCLSPRDDEQ